MEQPKKRQRRDDAPPTTLLLETSSTPFMSGKQAVLSKPREVGAFCVNSQRQFVDDGGESEARVYRAPRMGVPLSEGFDRYVEKDEDEREGLDTLLKWLLKHCQDKSMVNGAAAAAAGSGGGGGGGGGVGTAANNRRPVDLDFVTWRGHLTKIMTAPFENQPWQMAARLHRGTVYISEWETEAAQSDRQVKSQRQREMCFWGYRFEQYATVPYNSDGTNDGSGDGNGGGASGAGDGSKYADYDAPIVNSNKQYCSVVTTRIDSHKVLLSGEVDCITKPKDGAAGRALPPLGQRKYVELKTSRVLEKHKTRTFERYKLLKYWAQSFLLDVPHVVVGFRDDNGVVRKLQTFKTLEIPRMIPRDGQNGMWNAPCCLRFLLAFLTELKTTLAKKPEAYFLCTFDPTRRAVSIREDVNEEYAFLPEWYRHGLAEHH